MSGQNILAAASADPKVLYSGQNSATTETTLYTAPSSGSALLATFAIANATPVLTTLSSGITVGGGALTSLSVAALPAAIPSGATIIVGTTGNTQTWTLSSGAAAAATTISVVSQTPNTTYASGSQVIYGGQPVYVSVGVYQSGQTAGLTHHVIHNLLVAGGDTYSLLDWLAGGYLGPSDFVTVQASVANAINAIITGIENN